MLWRKVCSEIDVGMGACKMKGFQGGVHSTICMVRSDTTRTPQSTPLATQMSINNLNT